MLAVLQEMPHGAREDVCSTKQAMHAVMWPPGVCYVRVRRTGIALVSYMPLDQFFSRKKPVGHGRYLDRSDNFAAPDIKPCME